jgi:hypothetical protein
MFLILGRFCTCAQLSPIFDVLMTVILLFHVCLLEAQCVNASSEHRNRHSFRIAVFFKNIRRWTKSRKSAILSVMQHLRSPWGLVSFPSPTRSEQPIWSSWCGLDNAWYSIHFGCLSREGLVFVPNSKRLLFLIWLPTKKGYPPLLQLSPVRASWSGLPTRPLAPPISGTGTLFTLSPLIA